MKGKNEKIEIHLKKGELAVDGFADAQTITGIVNVLTGDEQIQEAAETLGIVPVTKKKRAKRVRKKRGRYKLTRWGGEPTFTGKAVTFLKNKQGLGVRKMKVADVISQMKLHRTGSSYNSVRNAAKRLKLPVEREGRFLVIYLGRSFPSSETKRPRPDKIISPSFRVKPKTVGRPTIVTPFIGGFIRDNEELSGRVLSKKIKKELGFEVSANTVCKYRRDNKLERVRKKPIEWIPCPRCGSTHIQRRGVRKLASGGFKRDYSCVKCNRRFSSRPFKR
ncbi:hypothetical protein GTO27_04400 [Candidatus Bathyarchaeota archaeon]|nr:hypothetical protein [Nitrososphaeria archaeon]NIO36927.1 hypothetical protein [Candidatus Bathyarchaeota archaeon]